MIRQLLKSVREYKKDTILAPVFIALEVVMEVVIPLLMANLIDYGIDGGDMRYIVGLGAALLASAVISLVFGVLAGRKAAVASAGFAKNLRHDMFYNVQNFSFSNIDKFSTSSIVTRLTTDVTNVQNAFQMLVRIAMRAPVMLIFALTAAFSIDVGLTTIFLAFIPVLGVGLWLVVRRAHPIFVRVFKRYDRLNNVVQENLHGIRVVKSFVREEHEKEKFGKISQEIYSDFSKAEKTIAFNAPLMQLCVYTGMLLISWFGARAIVASGGDPTIGLSTGELMSLMTYAMQILMALMSMSMILVMVTISRASVERITELLREKSDLTDPEDPITEVADGSIRFEHVTFRYGGHSDKPALDDVNLEIASGEMIGIIGGTGSAKSTLVQLIPRLYDVESGSVKVGGIDVRSYGLEPLRDAVSVVLQKNVLFSGTVKENLRWGNPDATDEELVHACVLAQADGFIREAPDGYDTYIEQGGANVSGGQKQRLCIARALLKKPKILILDDSTSAVDTRTDSLIRKGFREFLPETTKLIIAQRIASVQDADRIIVMDDGKISAFGTHEELLRDSEIYREVYESQRKGGDGDEE